VLPTLLSAAGRIVVLIKPQFEAGREEVGKGGVVRNPAVHARVIDEVEQTAAAVGLERIGLEPSPIEGAEGNREFLMLLRRIHDEELVF
jgi:23S rRNA (cytidine1920-2'-O)/16S rRNA (cytidine1409-2'-O)-methyltransferase